jgi:DNA repair protein RecO (recombination protein O)
MGTYRDTGVVLRNKTLRDADRHYAIYTSGHGKIVVLAKGSRKGKSKMSPHLAGFGVVDLMIAEGRLIDRLAGAGLVRPFGGILASLEKTAVAQSFLLAVDALTKRELPDERIFALIVEFLGALDGAPERTAVAGRSPLFDAAVGKLLEMLGHGLEIGVCVGCRTALVPDGNAMNVLRGGIECASCRGPMASDIDADAIKALRFFRTEPIAAAAALRVSPQAARQAAFITDLTLMTHLEDRFAALKYLKAVS